MEPDLEKRWQEATKQKNLDPQKLRAIIKEMEKGITIPENWNERMRATLVRERAEVEKKYGIKIGQTDISCARCGKPWGFGGHVCQDIRFKQLQQKEEENKNGLKDQGQYLLECLRRIGAKKLSTLSFDSKDGGFISERTLNQWIYRGNIPLKYVKRIEGLINSVSV